jgi:hypothetical protein
MPAAEVHLGFGSLPAEPPGASRALGFENFCRARPNGSLAWRGLEAEFEVRPPGQPRGQERSVALLKGSKQVSFPTVEVNRDPGDFHAEMIGSLWALLRV